MSNPAPARMQSLKVQNFRALRDVELKSLTPLTVLLGPNGSGKSTVFDVFAFLAECFEFGLRRAWDRRGRFRDSDMSRVEAFVAEGALLGHLWMEGHFGVGDPLVNQGGPVAGPQ